MDAVIAALSALRVPIQQAEYDLHRLVADALADANIPCAHEVRLAPHCRIDLLAMNTIGIEIKRGKPNRAALLAQLTRYAACPQLTALILVTEHTVPLPPTLHNKPLHCISLNRLWGIALG